MREQAEPLCAPCTIKGGFRGLPGRPQGTNKMNEVKRSRGWGLCHGGLGWDGGGLANATPSITSLPAPSLQDSPYITQTRLVSPKGHKRVKLKRRDESAAVIEKEKRV